MRWGCRLFAGFAILAVAIAIQAAEGGASRYAPGWFASCVNSVRDLLLIAFHNEELLNNDRTWLGIYLPRAATKSIGGTQELIPA
jgi:hypothetical protein